MLLPRAQAAAFGFVLFLAQGGYAILDPTRVAWIAPGSDYSYHLAGWIFFRHAEWVAWPLGAIPDLQYPAGSTVGLNDGIPWVALPLKLLAPILPGDLQYIGPWLALCFALQGWFGARLAQAISPSVAPRTAALAGAFLVCSPILLHRLVHEALCAHFLLVAAIGLCLRPSTRLPRAAPVLLTAAAAGVHPYLAAMTAVLCVAAVLRLRLGPARTAALVAVLAAVLVGLAFLFGYVGWARGDDLSAEGFGRFTADLLAVVSPGPYTWILPSPAPRPGVIEEPGWIGTGALVLLLPAMVLAARPPLRARRAWPLLGAALLLAFYAASPRLAVFGHVVVDLSPIYEPLRPLTGAFRIAGRFVWPLSYTITAGAVAVWILRRPRLAPWALVACGVLQIVDMKKLMFVQRWQKQYPAPAWSAAWDLARGDFDHLALYPPRCADTSFVCCPGFSRRPRDEDFHLATLATRTGLTLNSGGTARAFRSALAPYCEALRRDVAAGRLDARTIYRVAPEAAPLFAGAVCAPLDGELTCVSPAARAPFREALAGRTD